MTMQGSTKELETVAQLESQQELEAGTKQGSNKKLVMLGLMLGLIFSELDQTVVSTALPTIIRDLHGLSLYGWVAGIYMLAITMFMPIFGKLADIYGRKQDLFELCGLFLAGSIICGFADS